MEYAVMILVMALVSCIPHFITSVLQWCIEHVLDAIDPEVCWRCAEIERAYSITAERHDDVHWRIVRLLQITGLPERTAWDAFVDRWRPRHVRVHRAPRFRPS